MGKLRCCVIDDEPLAGKLIASYIQRTPTLEFVGQYQSCSDAIGKIMGEEVDLIFLDIEMPQINGMEFAKIVPDTCRIIFTTAYDRYAVEGFRVNAVDYLLKPVSYEEFLVAANRAVKEINGDAPQKPVGELNEFLLVKSEYKLIQIRISDILMIEGLKDYVKIFVAGQSKPVLTLMSMKAIGLRLAPSQFMRVHRSYIVNTKRISMIERNRIIVGEHVVPVSESYRDDFNAYIASLNPEEKI